jgi:hypothetical protein
MSEDRIEIDEVLSVLEGLMAKASSPIVRACLEEARNDIVDLTGRDSMQDGYERSAA